MLNSFAEPISVANIDIQLSDEDGISSGLVFSRRKWTCIEEHLGIMSNGNNSIAACYRGDDDDSNSYLRPVGDVTCLLSLAQAVTVIIRIVRFTEDARVPQGDVANVHVGWRKETIAAFFLCVKAKLFARLKDLDCEKADNEKKTKDKALLIAMGKQPESNLGEMETNSEIQPTCKTSRLFANFFPSTTVSTRPRNGSILPATNMSYPPRRELPDTAVQSLLVTGEHELELVDEEEERPGRLASLFLPLLRRTFKHVSSLFTPIMISMYIAIAISLIPKLKALFVEADGGKFLTPEFVGNMKIPLSALVLGIVLQARVTPRFGILLMQELTHRGVVLEEALVKCFVAMFLSGTSSAVCQLITTQVYAKDHDLDTLSALLLLQYVFMFIFTAVIIAIALLLL
ncbi:hypothetical protein ARMGADRAFT_1082566 [Armillaria gallica]|uniref:Auxin efflux carrier n=1 Tax=Armillaria gallica TaxID=47427 RepID=A0A2H3DJ05_ARMGA|nr:hypothetical protein ARMGADRAFT_1082566 [Armillaria gallica]